MRKIHRSIAIPAVALYGLILLACGPQNVNVTPQAQVAHYGTETVSAINALQSFVVQASAGTAPALSVGAATPIMDKIRTALLDAQKLSTALKEYDALTTVLSRQDKAKQIQTILDALQGISTISAALPSGLAAEGTRLVGNVSTTISSTRTALAGAKL